MKRSIALFFSSALSFLVPFSVSAQTSNGVSTLNDTLNTVYSQMVPLCANLIQVSQAVAGLGCIFYIGVRVWKNIARAEPIDFFSLLRPFCMTLLISMFPAVLGVINSVLNPTVTYTAQIVQHSNDVVNSLLDAQALQLIVGDTASVLMTPNPQGSSDAWDKYSQPGPTTSGGTGLLSAIGSGFQFIASAWEQSLRFVFQFIMSLVLQLLYYTAALCIDVVRTFQLIILAILGPLAFAFSCYDGFQQSLTNWIGKYINVYLWLPIANILGAIMAQIEQNMIQIDITRAQTGNISLFSTTDIAYEIFLLIGVIAYTTIPSLSHYIVHTHLPNSISDKVSKLAGMAVSAAVGGAGGGAGGSAGGGGGVGSTLMGPSSGSGFISNGKGQDYEPYQYQKDKIAG
jgi:conjugative transposon TraJ protein